MRLGNKKINSELNNIHAEARAIHFAMRNNAITYEEAKNRAEPLLERLNQAGSQIAQKYGIKYKEITFQNLGENL